MPGPDGVVNAPATDVRGPLVAAFGPALPDDVRQKIRAKADAAVRRAAEQQRSMRR